MIRIRMRIRVRPIRIRVRQPQALLGPGARGKCSNFRLSSYVALDCGGKTAERRRACAYRRGGEKLWLGECVVGVDLGVEGA